MKFTCELLIFMCLGAFCFCLPTELGAEPFGGGVGTELEPYLIYEPNQMQAIGADTDHWDKHFKLMADIDLRQYTGAEYNIIGNDDVSFTGVFDGNGHTISNFSYRGIDEDVGLFGTVGTMGGEYEEIKNLGLRDPNIINSGVLSYTGGLIAVLYSGTISECYVQGGEVSGDGSSVGGLIGIIMESDIKYDYNTLPEKQMIARIPKNAVRVLHTGFGALRCHCTRRGARKK